MKKFLYILILFALTSCGYEPIYVQKNLTNIEIKSIKLEGDKKINRKIISQIAPKLSKNNALAYDLELNSKQFIDTVAKDSAGNTTTYRMTVEVDLFLKGLNDKNKSKKFILSFTYNTRDNKFNLLQYQKNIENNLINKISQEIKIFLNS
jgi:hypothetical protein